MIVRREVHTQIIIRLHTLVCGLDLNLDLLLAVTGIILSLFWHCAFTNAPHSICISLVLEVLLMMLPLPLTPAGIKL